MHRLPEYGIDSKEIRLNVPDDGREADGDDLLARTRYGEGCRNTRSLSPVALLAWLSCSLATA